MSLNYPIGTTDRDFNYSDRKPINAKVEARIQSTYDTGSGIVGAEICCDCIVNDQDVEILNCDIFLIGNNGEDLGMISGLDNLNKNDENLIKIKALEIAFNNL